MAELTPASATNPAPTAGLEPEQVFYEGSPLARGSLGTLFLWGAIGILLIAAPFVFYFLQKYWWPWYVVLACVVIGLIALVIPVIATRTLRYRISSYRIDFERGLFGKRIDTLELWHVDDISFRQSFLDRILGVGTITVFSEDQTTPNLPLHGIPNARQVFEVLKQRVIKIKRSRGVIKVDTGN